MEKIKHIALVAHDNRKKDLIEWVEWNHKPLLQHQLICTGTTGRMIENALKWVALFTIILTGGCTAPHYIWPQKDIGFYEINPPALGKRVLIASRDSEFKRALVDRLVAAYTDQPVYLRIIGIEALTDEDANQFSAVVLINTCMGWTVDVEVERFLEKYGELASIIVLTTSDGGDVLPDMENRNIDAISSASVKDRVQPLAAMMIGKIDRLIQ